MSRPGAANVPSPAHDPSSTPRARRRLRRLTALLGGLTLALGLAPGGAGAAGPLVLFDANLDDCSVYGVGPASTAIKVTWKDADGTFKHVQTVRSKANGTFQTTCDVNEAVERGDVFTAKIGTRSRQFTVPPLNLRIDRVDNTISGKAPAGTELTIDLPTQPPQVVTADGGGAYSYDADLAGEDLLGSQWVTVHFTGASGDIVERSLQVPFVVVYRGRALTRMVGRPGSTMEVELVRDATPTASVRCALGPTGVCWLSFTDDDGHPIKVQTDDQIDIVGIADSGFVVRAVNVGGVPATDVISGTCDTDRATPWYLEAYRPAGSGSVSRSGVTTTAGTFSKDVTAKYDLRSGDKLYAECRTTHGDWVARLVTVP